LKLLAFLINTNIFISLGAVLFTLETQIQLGLQPQLHPYLFIIFFATLCEYNVHRFITSITNPEALNSPKHQWVKEHIKGFRALVIASVLGFIVAACYAKKVVIITLAPIGVLTVFYSLPLFKNKKSVFRLREIPLLKIFMIAFVWSASTILLPIIQTEKKFDAFHVITMIVERFIFVFAITIPFDIRDADADTSASLKTIPILIGKKKALLVADLSLLAFIIICCLHYFQSHQFFILPALIISGISTYSFINNKKMMGFYYYHYAILDGTMLLQGLLVCVSYYLGF
jgi:4-hydroxybenzoate polyprenyltransferase